MTPTWQEAFVAGFMLATMLSFGVVMLHDWFRAPPKPKPPTDPPSFKSRRPVATRR